MFDSNEIHVHLVPGLYVVATPIGNLLDITLRALAVLRQVSFIAAEDTRHSRLLLEHYSIKTPMLPLHAHNEHSQISKIIRLIQEGKSIALISDAGTPLVADPGSQLVHTLKAEGIDVIPVPGPCALIAALSASGVLADRFIFAGFLPIKSAERQARLKQLRQHLQTIVCYEAKHRILETLQDMQAIFGDQQPLVIARELTKQFETIKTGCISELIAWISIDENQQRGEFVLILPKILVTQDEEAWSEARRILSLLLVDLPLKQAVKLATEITGVNKNQLYQWALSFQKK